MSQINCDGNNKIALKQIVDESNSQDIRIGATETPESVPFVDISNNHPPYKAGTRFYAQGVMNTMPEYPDVLLQDGKEVTIEVFNNTGFTIFNGEACRQNGSAVATPPNGSPTPMPLIALALADNFTNAIIFGFATHDIENGKTGLITRFGIVRDIDTSLLPLNVPLYLSGTVPGALTSIAPDIASQAGGILVQGALNGQLFVSISNTINLPSTLAYFADGSIATTTLDNTFVNITDYATSGNIVMPIDPITGTITSPRLGL